VQVRSVCEELCAALQRLKQAVEEREPRVIWLKVEPAFEGLRKDQRFQRLISGLELE
jgi:hypothetical protein